VGFVPVLTRWDAGTEGLCITWLIHAGRIWGTTDAAARISDGREAHGCGGGNAGLSKNRITGGNLLAEPHVHAASRRLWSSAVLPWKSLRPQAKQR
jgi:hypothetical protein